MTATGGTRPADLRMARLHLRLGSLELARAELEAFAGAGELDPDALLDLAEVRWRTGDVSGAGVAAQAYLDEGGAAPLALVIAAEASAAAGRHAEGRRLAALALERTEVPLERLFAGLPRSGIWPMDPEERPEPVGELFAIPVTRPPRGAETPISPVERAGEAGPIGSLGPAGPTDSRGPVTEDAAPISSGLWDAPAAEETVAPAAEAAAVPLAAMREPDPAAELLAGRADLLAGRPAAAATRFALVLRIAPVKAGEVLEVLGGLPGTLGAEVADLEVVRGDALRLVGREDEARQAYTAAAMAIRPPGATAG